MLILLIESSSMCVSINEAQNSQVLKQLSPVSCGWTNPVWINMAVHPNWKKEEYNSAGSGGGSLLLFPFSLARNKENGNIESWILRLCTMQYYIGLYSAGCKEKIAIDETVFWNTVSEMKLKESIICCRKYPLLS